MADDKHPKNVDAYIQSFPQETQHILDEIRQSIAAVLPDATQVMSYGIPAFNVGKKHVVFFSGWKQHVSIYPIPHEDKQLLQELKPYIHGKGTLQFPLDKSIPYDLIQKVVAQLAKE